MPAPKPSAGLSKRDKRREIEMERWEVRGAKATRATRSPSGKQQEPLSREVGLTSQGRAATRSGNERAKVPRPWEEMSKGQPEPPTHKIQPGASLRV